MAELIAAVDIGTSKIATVVAELRESNNMEIKGFGVSVSKGMKKGEVTDVNALSASIQASIREAENMANCSISYIYAGVSGDNVSMTTAHGTSINHGLEITANVVQKAVKEAREYHMGTEHILLHAIPKCFSVDNKHDVAEPLGMYGKQLKTEVILVGCGKHSLNNLKNCLRRCKIHSVQFILEHLASSDAVLSNDEKDMGVCMVDIGGGTTDIAVFKDGLLKSTAVISVAGDHVTNDIARVLYLPIDEAEKLKRDYGGVAISDLGDKKDQDISGIQNKQNQNISYQSLVEVIHARYDELFNSVKTKLEEMDDDSYELSYIVLTGGSSLMEGVCDLAESVLKMPVRQGHYQSSAISYGKDLSDNYKKVLKDPRYATTIGLLLRGLQENNFNVISEHWWRRPWMYFKKNLALLRD